MEYRLRLNDAISVLAKVLENNKDFKNITIVENTICIKNKPDILTTFGYLITLLIIPTLFMTIGYQMKGNLAGLIIFSSIFVFLLGYEWYKVVRGEKIVLLDLNAAQLEVKNVNPLIGRFIKKEKINFDEIMKIRLFENVIYYRYSTTKWLELIVTKKDKNEVILTKFNKKEPENYIAEKVKCLFDAIIYEKSFVG